MFCSCSNEDIETKAATSVVNQQNEVDSAKMWFEDNPLKNNFSLLEFADKIDWEKAQSLNSGNEIAVEVPIILKQHIFLTADNSTISVNRLLFIKTAKNEFTPYIINISSSKKDFDLIKEIAKINYFSIPNDFTGKVLIINNGNKSVNLNVLVDGKEAVQKPNITNKEASVTCYEVVELFDTGPPRRTGIIFCLPDGGSDTTTIPYYGGGSHGTGTNATASDPCTTAKAATSISQDSNYLSAKASIITASADGLEHSITLGKDADGKITQAPMNNGTSQYLVATNTSWTGAFAALHNHPNNTPLSAGDIYASVKLNVKSSNFTTTFVLTDGEVYGIVVTDFAAAQAFVAAYPADQLPGYSPEFPDFIYNQLQDLVTPMGSSIDGKTEAIAFVLDKYNAGITLLKRDSDGEFKPIKPQETTHPDGSKTYTSTPCN
ncbi:hypothetical protein [Flavobacterium hiemivividum]|uniref:Uncharacterized protein n=1 Tax=Flavobacterium hiemivividum TaxID=2541734 RepID=A0A4R5D511_9FLAO|nr:hypothetical protein [Flavobacterium hiemivividum]TDE06661.1 hypothetical protein E0F98_03335 [Flavobacterium hiemivividum]